MLPYLNYNLLSLPCNNISFFYSKHQDPTAYTGESPHALGDFPPMHKDFTVFRSALKRFSLRFHNWRRHLNQIGHFVTNENRSQLFQIEAQAANICFAFFSFLSYLFLSHLIVKHCPSILLVLICRFSRSTMISL